MNNYFWEKGIDQYDEIEKLLNESISIKEEKASSNFKYDILEYEYYNLENFLRALITLPINKKVFIRPDSIYGNLEFTGTSSFEEAWNLCKFGMDDGYERFVEGLQRLNVKQSLIEKEKRSYSYVGYVPNVSKFLSGNPNNMKNKKKEMLKKMITIYMQVAYSASTSKEAINNRGICVLNMINYLEKKGYDCCLKFEDCSVCDNEMLKIIVPIKRTEEKLNVKLSYFPLVHPAFVRRLIFRATEIANVKNFGWQSHYGIPYIMSREEIASMDNTIYISTPTEMGIYGNSLDEDFSRFVNYIDEKYQICLEGRGDDKVWQKTYGRRV